LSGKSIEQQKAARTQQAMDKKKRLASKGTLAPVGTFGTGDWLWN